MALTLNNYSTIQRPLTKAEMDANWTAIIAAFNKIVAAQAQRKTYRVDDGKHIALHQLAGGDIEFQDVVVLAVVQGTKSYDWVATGDGIDLTPTVQAGTEVSVIYRLKITL